MKMEDYSKYYIQGSDHYLIPKDVFKELFNEMVNWKEESQKQKEVIDKAIEFYENNKQECVVGRNEEGKLIKKYYLPAHLSKPLIDILNEVSE